MSNRADDVTVAYPLFRGEGGGANPTSALQLRFYKIPLVDAAPLNAAWHSRFPDLGGGGSRACFAAEFDNHWWAVAVWTNPTSPKLPQLAWMMLKRFAIGDDAPRNTASRMMGWMIRELRKRFDEVVMLVSYSDPDTHAGTIYRATGWEHGGETPRSEATTWRNRERDHTENQTCCRVVRWFYQLRPTSPEMKHV